MNLRRYRKAVERNYTDRLTLERPVQGKKANGVTRANEEWQVLYENVPCRISQKALSSNRQTDTTNDIDYEIKLFIAPETDIRQGDRCTVNRDGVLRVLIAGEPFPYPSHLEVSMQREGKA